MPNKGTKKQFCINGHDTFLCGRNPANGRCRICSIASSKKSINAIRMGRRKRSSRKQFCVRGHDTFKYGRNTEGQCKECRRLAAMNWYKKHLKECRAQAKKWKIENKTRNRKYQQIYAKNYYQINKKELQERHKQYVIKRLQNDINFKLRFLLRNRLKMAIKSNQKTGSAVRNLGCTIEFLKQYLEENFNSRMMWNNYGTYWEIDHIAPLWKFDLTKKKEFLEAVNYKNLQPLTRSKHKKKTAKEATERAKLRINL